ncbi:ABC transporter permease subunit [Micromonospora sp. NPDC003197]
MIWLTWRQFRTEALVGVVALALLAAYLVHLGLDIRDAYDYYRAQCPSPTDCGTQLSQFTTDYYNTLLYLAALVGLIPGLLGMLIGLLLRRTVPAMALTILTFVVLQFFVPNVVRPILLPPQHLSLPMTAPAINQARGLGSISGAPVVKGLTVPNAEITDVSDLLTAHGQPLDERTFDDCLSNPPKVGATEGPFGDAAVCLANLDLHVDIAYQPRSRYWSFQWLESVLYLVSTGLLVAFGLWRIRRRS